MQRIAFILALVLSVTWAPSALAAWTPPPVTAPGCPTVGPLATPGCNVPINVSINPQVKTGPLGTGNLTVTGDAAVSGNIIGSNYVTGKYVTVTDFGVFPGLFVGAKTGNPATSKKGTLFVYGRADVEGDIVATGTNGSISSPRFQAGTQNAANGNLVVHGRADIKGVTTNSGLMVDNWVRAKTLYIGNVAAPGIPAVVGTFVYQNGSQGWNKVLTSDAGGQATWKSLSEITTPGTPTDPTGPTPRRQGDHCGIFAWGGNSEIPNRLIYCVENGVKYNPKVSCPNHFTQAGGDYEQAGDSQRWWYSCIYTNGMNCTQQDLPGMPDNYKRGLVCE